MNSLTHAVPPEVGCIECLPPKLAPTQRIIAARGDQTKCVCGRPAISCGYCSAECLEAEEAKQEAAKAGCPTCGGTLSQLDRLSLGGICRKCFDEANSKRFADGSLASPTPNARQLFALGTNVDGVPKLLNVQLHGPDSFIVWTNREAAEDYRRRFAAGDGYAVCEVK